MSAINHVDPHDPRADLATRDPGQSGRRRRLGENDGGDAAKVAISQQAAAHMDVSQAAGSVEAQNPPQDVNKALEMAQKLVAQLRSEPEAATAAQAHVNPRAALNLLI